MSGMLHLAADRSPLPDIEEKLRTRSSEYLFLLEAVLYIVVGILLSAAAAVAAFEAAALLWRGIISGTHANGLVMLDRLLLVLMLVEILHTVRISIRSKEFMLVRPFLIVGLIASIRRVLVITMQVSNLEGAGSAQAALVFRNAMIEFGLLGFLVLVLAFSMYLLHWPSQERL